MTLIENYSVDFSRLPKPILAEHPQWVALYDLAWELASKHVRKHADGREHMDIGWDRDINYQWVWDSCFVALYTRYAPDQFPGMASLDNFYMLQREDGYISMTYDMTTKDEPYKPDRINPPLFAWVEWEYFQTTGDDSRLSRVVVHIEKLMNWIEENRKTRPHYPRPPQDKTKAEDPRGKEQIQLYWFEDGGSSGMDDSPRSPRLRDAGQFYSWIDLSSQVALSYKHLANMRRHLGDTELAEKHEAKAKLVGDHVNAELWSEVSKFYHDRMWPFNFNASKTIAGFWPMISGFCPPDRVDDLVAHLENPKEFNRPTPIPSLSADDVNYCVTGTYWLGGVWIPTNYMVLSGLVECDRHQVAHRIASRYLEALHETWANHEPHTLWECYASETSAPGKTAHGYEQVKPNFVGWSGLGPISVLIENVIGIKLNVPENKVQWTIELTEEHGLDQLRVKGGTADFRCAKRADANAPAQVTLRSDVPLTVTLKRGKQTREVKVEAGKTATATV